MHFRIPKSRTAKGTSINTQERVKIKKIWLILNAIPPKDLSEEEDPLGGADKAKAHTEAHQAAAVGDEVDEGKLDRPLKPGTHFAYNTVVSYVYLVMKGFLKYTVTRSMLSSA